MLPLSLYLYWDLAKKKTYKPKNLNFKVRPESKLLGLYLMDSIMKNLKNTTNYIQIFDRCVVYLFAKVFEHVSFFSHFRFSNILFIHDLCLTSSVTNFFEGVKRVVSIWNFVRSYGPMMMSRNKIFGPGSSCYHAYLVPWVPLFGIFSLWRPATSFKINCYLQKINTLFV